MQLATLVHFYRNSIIIFRLLIWQLRYKNLIRLTFVLQTTNVLNVYEGHLKGIQCLVVVTPSGNEDPRVFTGSFDNSVHGYNMNVRDRPSNG